MFLILLFDTLGDIWTRKNIEVPKKLKITKINQGTSIINEFSLLVRNIGVLYPLPFPNYSSWISNNRSDSKGDNDRGLTSTSLPKDRKSLCEIRTKG